MLLISGQVRSGRVRPHCAAILESFDEESTLASQLRGEETARAWSVRSREGNTNLDTKLPSHPIPHPHWGVSVLARLYWRPTFVGNFVGNFVDLETVQHRDDSAQELSPMGGIRAGRKRLVLVKIQVSW